jgi:uncharacterized protein YqgC (DUF456 family)
MENKSKYTLGDFIGYGISIGSIIGTVVGVFLENPGGGWIIGMISGSLAGLIVGRKKVYHSVEL